MSTTVRYYPTGNGAQHTWTIGGSSPPAAAYDAVNDPQGSPNDDVDYLYKQNASGAHHFTIQTPAIPAGASIVSVDVRFRAMRTAAGTAGIAARYIIDGANDTAHSYSALTIAWADYTFPNVDNTITGLDWTAEQINGTALSNNITGIGFNATGMNAGEEIRVTQLYLEVIYDPPAGGGPGTPATRNYSYLRRRNQDG